MQAAEDRLFAGFSILFRGPKVGLHFAGICEKKCTESNSFRILKFHAYTDETFSRFPIGHEDEKEFSCE